MKRNKVKRLLSLMLSVAMVTSLVACGTKEEESIKPSETQKESEKTTSNEASEEPEKAEEPVTITVGVFDRGATTEEYGTVIDNRWTTLLQEAVLKDLNINLEYIAIPRSEEITKIQTLMAAGNEPDIFYTYNNGQMATWFNDGALADLTEYIEGTEIEENAGYLYDFSRLNGSYSAMTRNDPTGAQGASFIRKDLFDQVGVELGETNGHYSITPSQLYDALIKIKEDNLCDYPFAYMENIRPRDVVTGAFVTGVTEEIAALNMDSERDGFKDGIRYLNKCYNNGLINPDFALWGTAEYSEVVASGNWAYLPTSNYANEADLAALIESDSDVEVVAVELVHEDGTPAQFTRGASVGQYCCVSNNCENVDKAVELLYWFFTDDDAHLLGHHGIEGEHYEVQDGLMVAIDQDYNAKDRINCHDLVLPIAVDPCNYIYADKIVEVNRKNAQNVEVFDLRQEATEIGRSEGKFVEPVLNAVIPAEVDYAAELAENGKNLYLQPIIAAEDKFDEVYDSYYEILMKEGGEELRKQRAEAYANTVK